jgi:hypothetical protein
MTSRTNQKECGASSAKPEKKEDVKAKPVPKPADDAKTAAPTKPEAKSAEAKPATPVKPADTKAAAPAKPDAKKSN